MNKTKYKNTVYHFVHNLKWWKVRMDPGWDPKAGFFRVDCYQYCVKQSGPYLLSGALLFMHNC